ncbi:MAG: adenylosuccinate lyase [Phototrophicales bacterium]|nr:MAG: adenylosuccinate lyase [Phototrophicales bacterium]
MTEIFSHETFLSPFTWRYGGDEMRHLWSDAHKRRLWRRVWVALAQAQVRAGLVTQGQVDELRAHQNSIDINRAHAIEAEIHHDLMAELHVFAEQCPNAGGIIHLGATSMDIEDNADAIRLKQALALIITQTEKLLALLADMIDQYADHVCMAFTHLQPAEPTTIGYRLANYAQDLLNDYASLKQVYAQLRGKGLKGAVGTAASYAELLHNTSLTPDELEADIMRSLEIDPFLIAHQTYPRHQDWLVMNSLAGIAMTVYRLAFDIRLLQSPPFGEWAEPFGTKQVGSSAMPFKRNPINAENIDSLARYVATLPRVAWDNAAHSLLERTLDDSANRRIIFAEGFLATDEILSRAYKILKNLRIDEYSIRKNVEIYGVFAATERLLMEAVKRGGNRQDLHEVIRERSLQAWEAIRRGEHNPLRELLMNDTRVLQFISQNEIPELLDASGHVGTAPQRAKQLAQMIRASLEGSA